MSKRFLPRYGGRTSAAFWRAIRRIQNEKQHSIAYSAGILLQNMEAHCLGIIKAAAERDMKAKKPAGRRGSEARRAQRVARIKDLP